MAKLAAKAQVKRLILIHRNPPGWTIEPDLPAVR
jgi:ribonuclease BN (tRNA processing enzyme)